MNENEEYVNIMEAARRCKISDKTVRRAIAAQKLKVHRPKANVALIAVADLEAWHDLKTDPTDRRIAEVETRIAECHRDYLELMKRTIGFHDNLTIIIETEKYNTIQQLHKMMEVIKTQDEHIEALERQVRTLTEQLGQLTGQEIPQPDMPGQPLEPLADVMPLNQFADLHGMAHNESEQLWKRGFIKGQRESKQGRKRGSILIDSEGMHDFWVQFHDRPDFRACDHCPHNQDNSLDKSRLKRIVLVKHNEE